MMDAAEIAYLRSSAERGYGLASPKSVLSLLDALEASQASPVTDKGHPRFMAGYDAGLKDGRLELAEAEARIKELEASLARRWPRFQEYWDEIASLRTRLEASRRLCEMIADTEIWMPISGEAIELARSALSAQDAGGEG